MGPDHCFSAPVLNIYSRLINQIYLRAGQHLVHKPTSPPVGMYTYPSTRSPLPAPPIIMASAEYTPLIDSSIDIRKAYNALSPSERTSLESSLKRRLDRRLFPCLVTFYLLNYIDRNALPAARLLGVESDLNLSPRE